MFRPRVALVGIVVIWSLIITIYYIRKKPVTVFSKNYVESEQPTVKPEATGETALQKQTVTKKHPKPAAKTKEDEEIAKNEPELQGEIKSGEKMCLDTLENKNGKVGLWECHGEGRNQFWIVTKDHMIRNDALCVQAPAEKEPNRDAKLSKCNDKAVEQKWLYKDNMFILKGTNNCLNAASPQAFNVVLCDKKLASQKFHIEVLADLGAK